MSAFWIATALMTAATVAVVVFPLLRASGQQKAKRAEYDITVYKDQLAEIDRDFERGLLAEAEADAMIVVEAVPGWVNPKVLLGGALAMQRRCEEALPHLEQVVALMPEHHIGYMNRGSCRYRVGDVDGSIEDAKKACALGNDRACRTAPKLERRKIWKENLKRKAAEKAAAAEAANAAAEAASRSARAAASEAAGGELAAPPDADGAHEDGPHGDAAKGEPAAPAGAPGAP